MVGVMVRDLGAGELNWRLLAQARTLPITFFVGTNGPPCGPVNGPRMRWADAWGFRGPVVAMDLEAARRLIHFPSPGPKVLYCWDLDWLRRPDRMFHELRGVYTHPRLAVVARTDRHASLLQQLWGASPRGAVPDADLLRILGHLP